jgi:repressor LexA
MYHPEVNVEDLSPRRQQVLEYIQEFLSVNSYPPTVRDVMRGCGLSSSSVADYHLKALERLGYLRRRHEVSRGLELLDKASTGSRLVPLVGVIAAGAPIPVPSPEVWDSTAGVDRINLAEDVLRRRENVFALKVRGTSMIDALINDGDIVLMQAAQTVENGEMAAVWLKAEKETTLKKVYREPGRIRLQPANSLLRPFYTTPDNVAIQGRVIGVIRRLG